MVSCLLRFKTIAFTALFAAGVLVAQDSNGAKKPSTKHATHTVKKKTAKAASSSKTAASKTASHRRKTKPSKKSVASRRSYQQQPTPERYKEIQQALAEKGYFNGAVDGNWGAESVDALKRFQREQNLTDDGKLGSLSLIALGLGPKRAEPLEKAAQR